MAICNEEGKVISDRFKWEEGQKETDRIMDAIRFRISEEFDYIEGLVGRVLDNGGAKDDRRALMSDIMTTIGHMVHLAMSLGWIMGKKNPTHRRFIYLDVDDYISASNKITVDLSPEHEGGKYKPQKVENRKKHGLD